jgi:predicted acetyltransferase
MAHLISPSEAYRDSYLAALAEFHQEGRYREVDPVALAADFGAFARRLRSWSDPAQTPPGRVPETIFWLVEGQEFIGRVSIRHALNDWLRQIGGHIGYDIRPSWRRQGYGTRILALALPEARRLGLSAVLVTCDADNVGSKAIIERNGGRLESAALDPGTGVPILRYWIDLEPVPPPRPVL